MLDIKKFAIMAAFVFLFLLVYSPHLNYTFPLHIDEWKHIGEAEKILHGKAKINFESGYHILLAFLFMLQKPFFDPIIAYKFLPAIFALLTALVLFFFIRDFWLSFFSIIFFAALPSNVNILGLWFAVPLTASIPLFYLFFFLFSAAIEKNEKKFFFFSFLTMLLLLVVYPLSALFAIFVMIFCAAKTRKNIIWILFILLLPLLFLIIFLLSGIPFELITKSLFFKHGWTPYETTYFFPKLYGIVPFLLALPGIFFALKEKKHVFVIAFFFSLIFLFSWHIFKFTIMIPYQRALYFSMLSAVPLSALGISKILSLLENFLEKKEHRAKKIIKKIIFVSIVLIILLATFWNYGNLPKGLEIYHLIDNEDYKALKWLSFYSSNQLVISSLEIGSAIWPISKNYALADIYFIGNEEKRSDIKKFFSGNCETKKEIAKKYSAKIVYSEVQLKCEFLQPIYAEKLFIYSVSW